MGQLRLKGIVQYAPGPWGAAVPASGVAVEIIDVDANLRSNDLIWTGVTGSDGTFAGISSEWQDTVTIGFGAAQRQVADVTDVLSLSARLVEIRAGQSNEVTLPFQFIRNDFLSPPLVLPWEPLNAMKGKVNGIPCWTLNEFVERAKSSVQSRTLADAEVFGKQLTELESAIRQAFNQIEHYRLQETEQIKRSNELGNRSIGELVERQLDETLHKSAMFITNLGNPTKPFLRNTQNSLENVKQRKKSVVTALTEALRTLAVAISNVNIEAPVKAAALLIINSVIIAVSATGSIPDIIIRAMSSVVTVVVNLGGYLANNAFVIIVAMVCVIILIAAYLAATGFNIAAAGMRITHDSMMVSVRNMR